MFSVRNPQVWASLWLKEWMEFWSSWRPSITIKIYQFCINILNKSNRKFSLVQTASCEYGCWKNAYRTSLKESRSTSTIMDFPSYQVVHIWSMGAFHLMRLGFLLSVSSLNHRILPNNIVAEQSILNSWWLFFSALHRLLVKVLFPPHNL